MVLKTAAFWAVAAMLGHVVLPAACLSVQPASACYNSALSMVAHSFIQDTVYELIS